MSEGGGSVFREHFADFGDTVYMNCAYHGALPKVAVEAGLQGLELKAAPHRIRDEDHFDYPDAYRRAAAELVGARPEEVAVADSATHGIGLVAFGLDWRPGDEVVLPAGEFPSNRFPWLSLESRGVVVREVPLPADGDPVEALAAAVGRRTRVVAASWVSYATGRRIDLARLGRMAREAGAVSVVDGTQGVGGLPLDLAETPVDLLACAGYKWLLGPYGLGFAVVGEGWVERLDPPGVNWFALTGARDFARLDRARLELVPEACRFDVNEPASFANVAAGTASLRLLGEIGPERAARHVADLLDRVRAGLPDGFHALGGEDPGERSNILCLTTDEERLDGAADRLRRAGIVVSRRQGALRVSPYLWNGAQDVERLLEALAAA